MKLNLVPARTGLTWIREGVQTFFRNPLGLSSTFMLLILVLIVLSLFSIAGSIAALLLLPTATLVMMSATRLVSQSSQPTPGVVVHALSDMRASVRGLLLLGLLYAAGYLLILGISYLIDGGILAHRMLLGGDFTPEQAQLPGFAVATLVTAILSLPLSLMFWLAPGLLHWHAIAPTKALFFSLVAGLRNWRAYAVFLLGWMAIIAALNLALLLLGLILVATGSSALGMVMQTVSMAAMLVIGAIFLCSLYFPLRDSFIPD